MHFVQHTPRSFRERSKNNSRSTGHTRDLRSVGPLMHGQAALHRESLPAVITFVRLFSSVSPLMLDYVVLP